MELIDTNCSDLPSLLAFMTNQRLLNLPVKLVFIKDSPESDPSNSTQTTALILTTPTSKSVLYYRSNQIEYHFVYTKEMIETLSYDKVKSIFVNVL